MHGWYTRVAHDVDLRYTHTHTHTRLALTPLRGLYIFAKSSLLLRVHTIIVYVRPYIYVYMNITLQSISTQTWTTNPRGGNTRAHSPLYIQKNETLIQFVLKYVYSQRICIYTLIDYIYTAIYKRGAYFCNVCCICLY